MGSVFGTLPVVWSAFVVSRELSALIVFQNTVPAFALSVTLVLGTQKATCAVMTAPLLLFLPLAFFSGAEPVP